MRAAWPDGTEVQPRRAMPAAIRSGRSRFHGYPPRGSPAGACRTYVTTKLSAQQQAAPASGDGRSRRASAAMYAGLPNGSSRIALENEISPPSATARSSSASRERAGLPPIARAGERHPRHEDRAFFEADHERDEPPPPRAPRQLPPVVAEPAERLARGRQRSHRPGEVQPGSSVGTTWRGDAHGRQYTGAAARTFGRRRAQDRFAEVGSGSWRGLSPAFVSQARRRRDSVRRLLQHVP